MPSAKTVTGAVTFIPGSKVLFFDPSLASPASRVWTPITRLPSKRSSAPAKPGYTSAPSSSARSFSQRVTW